MSTISSSSQGQLWHPELPPEVEVDPELLNPFEGLPEQVIFPLPNPQAFVAHQDQPQAPGEDTDW